MPLAAALRQGDGARRSGSPSVCAGVDARRRANLGSTPGASDPHRRLQILGSVKDRGPVEVGTQERIRSPLTCDNVLGEGGLETSWVGCCPPPPAERG